MSNNAYEKTPRRIIHDNYPENARFGRIPTFAIAPINRCLTDGERRLFIYYALQANGFAPSFYEIFKNTGIVESNSSRIRKHLAEKGFIFFIIERDGRDSSIHIRWDQIWEFAQQIIQKDLEQKQVGVTATPITNKVLDVGKGHPKISARSMPRLRRHNNRAIMTASEKRLLGWLEKLPSEEKKDVCDAWRQSDRPPY